METITLDGAHGEGGGQILRSALTLSMITGKPFCLGRIRAKRAKPGLLRQHLTAVQAAATVCGAQVSGAALASQSLSFVPGPIRGGEYHFAIGTAGSCTLVVQTVLPALWFADRASTLTVSGGTHNPSAPPADFLMRAWLPLMHALGVDTEIELRRHGFFPAGGGEVLVRARPVTELRRATLTTRGELLASKAIAIVAGVPADVAQRELAAVSSQLGEIAQEMRVLPAREGPGNALLVELRYPQIGEVFTAFGKRGLPAATVAEQVVRQVRTFLDSAAAIGEHLADQVLLPMALAGGGEFTTTRLSSHLLTNLEVIGKFLPVDISLCESGNAARVALRTRATGR